MTAKQHHIVELQSLRGVAAVAVMFGHAANYFATPDWFPEAAKIFNGRAAVVLFFVLSGFVLTKSLKGAGALRIPALVTFYIRRFARIYPAVWVVSTLSLAYLVLLHWRFPIPDTSAAFRERFPIARMDALHIVASYAAMLAFLLPQLWSIFVEIIASLAVPFIGVAAMQRGRRLFWLFAAAALVLSFTIGPRTYYLIGLYTVDFFIGAWLATAGRDFAAFNERLRPHAKLIFATLCLAISLTQFLPTDYYSPLAALIEAGLACGMISLLVYCRGEVRWLNSRVALFIGDISYSIYLVHYLVICLIGKAIGLFELETGLQFAGIPKSLVLMAATAAVTIPLSALLYRWVEMPGMQFGKWASARLLELPASVRRAATSNLKA
jgi:peptidoglycan/LPS O-acetylase OafA/YrhL